MCLFLNLGKNATYNCIIVSQTRFCSLENEPEERHPMNQSILFNHGKVHNIYTLYVSNMKQEFGIFYFQFHWHCNPEDSS